MLGKELDERKIENTVKVKSKVNQGKVEKSRLVLNVEDG